MDSLDELVSESAPLGMANKEDVWLVEKDLDAFFARVYSYYKQRGFGSIVAQRVVDLMSSLFTIVVTTVLMACFDWRELQKCSDVKESCHGFGNYTISPWEHVSFFKACVLLGAGVSFVYWIALAVTTIPVISQAYKTRAFYRNRLKMTTRDIQTAEWSEIVEKLKHLQDSGYRLQINNAELNALTISQRIMRKDNYMIALMCMEVLPVGSPSWRASLGLVEAYDARRPTPLGPSPTRRKFKDSNLYWLGQSLEFNLFQAIGNHVVDDKFQLNKKAMNARAVRTRMYILALINLILTPLILVFSVIHFFLRYAEEFHSKKNYLGPRFWSPHALWILREFNEMPHNFDRRIYSAVRPAERFLRLFPSPVPLVLARGAAFILGGLVAVLLVFGLVDDSVLLHVRVWDRNLLWYFAVLSAGLAASRALIPPPEEEFVFTSPNAHMRRTAALTHFLPEEWRRNSSSYDVRDKFSAMIPFRLALLLRELVSVICVPYVLAVVLPRYADDVAKFFYDNTVTREGLGDVCTFSLMDLKSNGDPKWQAMLESERDRRKRQVDHEQDRATVLFDGKLEKSWISFRIQYAPEYSGLRDPLGEQLFDRVREFQTEAIKKAEEDFGVMGASSIMPNFAKRFPRNGDGGGGGNGGGMAAMDIDRPGAGTGEDMFWMLEAYHEHRESAGGGEAGV